MKTYKQFVKTNYKHVEHLPNNMRLKELGKMWKSYQTGGFFGLFEKKCRNNTC